VRVLPVDDRTEAPGQASGKNRDRSFDPVSGESSHQKKKKGSEKKGAA